MNQEQEIKIKRASDAPVGASADSRRVEGYALKFDQPSELMFDWERRMSYSEVISREAVTPEILKKSDVICYLDHNCNKMLARSRFGEGTLKLEIDEVGVKYSFDAPNTVAGDEALELIRRGDVFGSSFYASVSKDSMEWTRDGKKGKCVIRKFDRFFDVSPVQRPAYECTEAVVRSMAADAIKDKEPPKGYENPYKKRYNNY